MASAPHNPKTRAIGDTISKPVALCLSKKNEAADMQHENNVNKNSHHPDRRNLDRDATAKATSIKPNGSAVATVSSIWSDGLPRHLRNSGTLVAMPNTTGVRKAAHIAVQFVLCSFMWST